MDPITTLAVGTLVTTLVTVALRELLAKQLADLQSRRLNIRAHTRITAKKTYFPGAVVDTAYAPGVGAERYRGWYIESVEVGCYILRGVTKTGTPSKLHTQFTGPEFEAHDFTVDGSRVMARLDGSMPRIERRGDYADETRLPRPTDAVGTG